MGLIKTLVTPIAIIAMRMSFPSDKSEAPENIDNSAKKAEAKENAYTAISEKKKQQDAWFKENPWSPENPEIKPEDNPYLVTQEELDFWNEYNLEKLKESELNSGLDKYKNVEDEVSKKFGDKFGDLYETAIKNFLSKCNVLPAGGLGSIIKPALPADSIKSDLQKAGEEAYRETFLGESDPNDSAKKFGDEFAEKCYAAHEQQITSWSVIPAAPPATPVTLGGPIIAMPTVSLIPVMMTAFKSAMEKTYPEIKDPNTKVDPDKIAVKFASKLGPIGIAMGLYGLTCSCPSGGGNIIVS